jgi:hypothetical protein
MQLKRGKIQELPIYLLSVAPAVPFERNLTKGLTRLFMLAFLWGQFRQFAETPIDSHFVHGTEGELSRTYQQMLWTNLISAF